jgi:hypothetical protein
MNAGDVSTGHESSVFVLQFLQANNLYPPLPCSRFAKRLSLVREPLLDPPLSFGLLLTLGAPRDSESNKRASLRD